MELAFQVIGFAYLSIAFLVWCKVGYYMFQVVALRKPRVRMWQDTYFNPFHLIFMPSKLTRAGLVARRNLLISSIIFIVMILLPLLFLQK